MLKNYFKIAWRNIYRHPSYSAINILGLAIGFASAIVIGLWVYQEWSYDRQFQGADRIYQVGVNFMNMGDMAVSPPQLNNYIMKFPDVEQAGRLERKGNVDVHIEDQVFHEANVYSADSTFFKVFSYDFIQGSAASAMNQPHRVVLTKEAAVKFFGSQAAMGKTIFVGDNKKAYNVVGVVDTKGYKSHMNASMWLSYEYGNNTNWRSANVYDYVKLRKGAPHQAFKKQLDQLIKKVIYPSLSVNTPYKKWIKSDASYRFVVMPLTDIYLKSDSKFEPTPGGSESNVIIFFAIALLIILIAAVNFINITTARASLRAKEVGIRKTLGTGRGALAGQFLAEAVLISTIALIIGLGLGELFLSLFEKITGVVLLEGLLVHSGQQLLIISAIALVIGLLAGSYPAFYLAGFKPANVLKGQIHSRTGEQGLFRNGLVVLQFTISIALLAGAGVIYQQLKYMRTKDLGLNKDNVLVIPNADELGKQKEAFRQKMIQYSGVKEASYVKRIPASSSIWISRMKTRDMDKGITMQSFPGDYAMLSTLGFRILKGRGFSKEVPADTQAVLLNQSAVKALGLKKPLGTELNDHNKVIGVVADFNYESLRKNIQPTVLEFYGKGERLAIKVNGDTNVVKYAESMWKQFGAAHPMSYYFMDQNYEQLLKKDRVMAKAVVLFTILAIFISCLGLYGLSSFIIEQRTKEVGIRRILGASVSQILGLLNKSFTKPILISIVIAIPLSFVILNKWLQSFAYKINLGPGIFLLSGGLAIVIALATVSWQSVKAALANPVDSLRSE